MNYVRLVGPFPLKPETCERLLKPHIIMSHSPLKNPLLAASVREHKLYKKFALSCRGLECLSAQRLVAAVSGGGDSMALALLAAAWASDHSQEIILAYFDHETAQARNREEWNLVHNLARVFSISALRGATDSLATKITGRGREDTWRKRRYAFLFAIAGKDGLVLTGHTLDDAAETFLLAAVRGGSGGAMAGVRRKRNDGVVRPLLGLRRSELRDLLVDLGVEWVEDPTNESMEEHRAFVRHKVLPEIVSMFGPSSINGLARSALLVEEWDSLVENLARKAFGQVVDCSKSPVTVLDLERLRRYHPSVIRRVIRDVLVEKFDKPGISLTDPVEQLYELIKARRHFQLGLPRGLIAKASTDALVIEVPNSAVEPTSPVQFSFPLPVPGHLGPERIGEGILSSKIWFGRITPREFHFSLDTALIDADQIWGSLRVRNRKFGDRFVPMGLIRGRVKLKKYLRDRAVPLEKRWRLPVVTDNSGKIIWIPGTVRSNLAPITPATRVAILLKRVPSGGSALRIQEAKSG